MSDEKYESERDEATIGKLIRVNDYCRDLKVDPTPVMPQVEKLINTIAPIREAAKDMKGRERGVVADAIADAVKREMQ